MPYTHHTTPEQLAALILTLAASTLDESATLTHPLTGHEIPRCMTQGRLDVTMWTAAGAVDHIPNGRLRDQARAAARKALPPVTGTVAEYADLLRQTAAPFRLAA